MQPRIYFDLLDGNPTDGTTVVIALTVSQYFYTRTTTVEFVDTPDAGKVTIGASATATAVNLAQFMYDLWAEHLDCLRLDGQYVYINALGVDLDMNEKFGTYIGGPVNYNCILSRSPYHYRIMPYGYAFDSATTEIRIWTGDVTSDRPTDPQHTISKSIIQIGQPTIDFVISEFVADYLKNEIVNEYDNGVNDIAINRKYCYWVECTTTIYNTSSVVGSSISRWYAVDGYGLHEQGFNPNILFLQGSIKKQLHYNNSIVPYFFTNIQNVDDVGYVNVYDNNDNIVHSFYGFPEIDDTLTSFTYVNFGKLFADNPTVEYFYINDRDTFVIYRADSCKYPVYQLVYKNRFGVWAAIPFPMRNKTTVKREATTYQPVISTFGNYNTMHHAKATRNVKGTKTITLNTDFIPEEYNEAFEQLMMSEFVYLQTDNDTYIPVTVDTQSLTYKQKIFDKLCQYTIDVEVANNLINQVY